MYCSVNAKSRMGADCQGPFVVSAVAVLPIERTP